MGKVILIPLRSQQKRQEVNGSDHLRMIFNDIIENAEQLKLKNQKKGDIKNYFRS